MHKKTFHDFVKSGCLTILALGTYLVGPTPHAGTMLLPIAAQATLNMKEAELSTLIQTVSKLTGYGFVLDPRVNKNLRVTIISPHLMNEDEIFEVFLSVLKVNGMTAVKTGPVYKIMMEQQARQDSNRVVTGTQNDNDTDELITRVVKLKNVSAQEMQIFLRPLIRQQGGHISAYRPTNVLVITDYAANVERIMKIIDQVDRESNQEFEVIPLEHASASEVVRILESLSRSQRQQPKNELSVRFVADERTNSILLAADKNERLRYLQLIKRLDTPLENNGNTKVIYVRYAKAKDLAKVLEGVGKSIEEEEKQKKASGGRRGQNSIPYSIEAHEETNSLVITAPPDLMRSFEDVIKRLDIRRAQVHVEAIIVEISEDRAKQLGVQWLFGDTGSGTAPAGIINFSNTGPGIGAIAGAALQNRGQDNGSVSITDPSTGVVTTTNNTTSGDNGQALAQVLGGLRGAGIGAARIVESGLSFAAFLNALARETGANILSTPSITTLDNQEASIVVGQEVPIITGRTLGDNNSNPFQTLDRKEVGIKLKIKPQINEGNAIQMSIEQEVSSIAGATSADVITNKRSIKTSVMVDDGGMIVLGGLIDDQIQTSSEKVPLLGDIPIVGHLFSSEGTTKVKRNLMVFIRPTIVRDSNQIRQLSRSKYNYIRALQLEQQADGIPLMPTAESPELPKWDESLELPPSFEDYIRDKKAKDDAPAQQGE
ncbi:MAG: type II secretion system protein GspD [Gammaproteobacteria bacterium]|nr:MAG: type II secretion system protein GspD [Gammaproteobacteria bacterium]